MHLLLVEDKDSFRRLLIQALADSGWTLHAVGTPAEALAILADTPCEVMVTDLRLPEMSGLELLKRAKRLHPGLRVLLMSAFGEAADIVEAMAAGAEDFLPKPFDLDLFQATLERMRALVEAPCPDPREPWVACSAAMIRLERAMASLAESSAPTLFTGERGSGRSRAARRLHTLRSPRAPLLDLEASSLGPLGLDGRRLAQLKGGTIHLRNLEGLSASGASELLEALGRDGVCWTATAASLEQVPPSLHPKLCTFALPLPPLRERREDVLPLFSAFLGRTARQAGRSAPVMDKGVERELLSRPWPGNVAELLWVAEQAMIRTTGPLLATLPEAALPTGEVLDLAWPAPGTLESMLAEVVRQAEARLLRRALRHRGCNLTAVALDLGVTQRLLSQRLREYHIPLEDGEEGNT
nr:response regulator [uncultured Holophaga sp.]